MRLRTLAPAKINVCLHVGPVRADGRHELVTVMQSISLADRVTLGPAAGGADEVVCPGVEGENLAAVALARFRAASGWEADPVRVEIDKRIPVAGGLAGGSADAAAVLRLAARAAGLDDDALLLELAAGLGADVPAQVRPGRVLATGAGERLRRVPGVAPYAVVVVPHGAPLRTPAVFARADELGTPRDAASLESALQAVERALPDLPDELCVNELEAAAIDLVPELEPRLSALRGAGADVALVSGSGPTVLGLFRDHAAAQAAAGVFPEAVMARPVGPDAGEVLAL